MSDPAPPLYGLSIVVPVYNGAQSVPELVAALSALEVAGGLEIILVNDCSPDTSLDVITQLARNATRVPVTAVDLAKNAGEHNAVMAGLLLARGAYIITMDDDLQNPPEEVVKLYDHARLGDFDVVYTYYAEKQHAGWRNLGSKFNGWMAGFLIGKPKGLYLCSFRCMSAFTVREITKYEGPYPYVDGLILQVTRRIGTIQVHHLPRAVGRSNYTLRRLVRLWMAMALGFSIMPLRLATLMGLAVSFLGVLWLLVILAEWLIGDPPTGYSSLAALISIFSGAQLIMLGIVGEYLGRVYLTLNKSPQQTVRTIIRSPAVDSISAGPISAGDLIGKP